MRTARQTCLAAALLGLTLAGWRPAPAAELTVAFFEGIERNRNFEVEGQEDRQWARAIGPEMSAFMQVVHVPVGWSDRNKERRSPLTVSENNAAGVAGYAKALETIEPTVRADFDRGSRVVSGLQAVVQGERDFVGRFDRIWQIWEVLADARGADTLSISFAAVQTLQHVGVRARLGLYPAGERMAFGVLIDSAAPRSAKDELVVDMGSKNTLFAVDRRAVPDGRIDPGSVVSWSWAEMTAIDWDPEIAPELTPSRGGTGGLDSEEPDICAQAAALRLECRSSYGDDRLMIAGSVGLLVLLVLWGGLTWRRRRERLQRVAEARVAKKDTEF